MCEPLLSSLVCESPFATLASGDRGLDERDERDEPFV